MTDDDDFDGVTARKRSADPAALAETMASAVERLRHLAVSAFGADPDLFDPPHDSQG